MGMEGSESEVSIPFALNASADAPTFDSGDAGLRAFNYEYEPNEGKDYPKPVLKFVDGQSVPVVMVIQKSGVANSRIIVKENWIYEAPEPAPGVTPPLAGTPTSGGRIYVKERKLNAPIPVQPVVGESGWKMLCIVGGNLTDKTVRVGRVNRTQKVITFKNVTPEIIDADDKEPDVRSLESIYMNEEWVDLDVSRDASNNLTFTAKERVPLKNQGVMLMIRATNKFKTKKSVPLRGFRVASDKLAFEGEFNLTRLTFGKKPEFDEASYVGYIRPPKQTQGGKQVPALHWLSQDEKSHFYVCVAMPTEATTANKNVITDKDTGKQTKTYDPNPFSLNVHVSSLLGDRYEVEGKVKKYGKKTIRHGSFISVSSVEIYQRDLLLPIESYLMDEDTGVIFKDDNIDYDNALNNHNFTAVQVHGEAGRYFNMPSENHLRILFPNMRGGEATTNMGVGSKAILNMGSPHNDKSSWDTATDRAWDLRITIPAQTYLPEKIEAFGEVADYHAQYRLPSGETAGARPAYGLRFMGNGNKYLAAYRYEVVDYEGQKMMKIRVRELGPTRWRTTIDQIANEDYWNSLPEWDQREVTRYMPSGRYWSTTSYSRVATPGGFGAGNQGAASVAKVLLDRGEDGQTTYPWGAFVTDATRLAWCENPRVRTNQVNSGFALVTNQKNAVQGR